MISAMILVSLSVFGNTMADGAVMRVYEVDRELESLAPLVPGQSPNIWLRIEDIDLDGSRGDFGPVDDDFMVLIDAELRIRDAGEYDFRLTSDDGSQLWIGGTCVVDNDGLHGARAKDGRKVLDSGRIPMQIKFFERGTAAMLRLEWRPPGAKEFQLVSGDAMQCSWPESRPVTGGPKEVAPRLKVLHDVGPAPAGPHNQLSDAQREAGWVLLFDGKSGHPWWRGFKKEELPEGWVVEEGMLVRAAPAGDIVTRAQYDDFDFFVDWMVPPGGNSGIFFNATEDCDVIYFTAPEMQILDNIKHQDGVTALQSAGANYALHAPPFDSSRPAGQWNRARIRVQGDHVQQWLNGVKTADYVLGSEDWKRRVAGSKFAQMPDYGTRPMGHIGLQDHGDRVAFRNIRIRRLDDLADDGK